MNAVVPLFHWVVMVIQDMTVHRIMSLDASDSHPEPSSSHVADDVPADIATGPPEQVPVQPRINFLNTLKGNKHRSFNSEWHKHTVGWGDMQHTVVHAVFSLRSLVDTEKPSQKMSSVIGSTQWEGLDHFMS